MKILKKHKGLLALGALSFGGISNFGHAVNIDMDTTTFYESHTLTKVYSKRIHPQAEESIAVVTSNLSTTASGALGDTMIAVIRYRDAESWKLGDDPESGKQARFDVVGFNDNYGISGTDQNASSVRFTADGESYYDILVMPRSNDHYGTASLFIGDCESCGFPNDVYFENIEVKGNIQTGKYGNVIDNAGAVMWGGGDPELFVFRAFPNSEDVENGVGTVRHTGYGVYNNPQGYSTPAIKDSDFEIAGREYDIVLLGNKGNPDDRDIGSLKIGYADEVIGMSSRPTTWDCPAPASADDIPDNLADTGCFRNGRRGITEELDGEYLLPYEVAQPFWSDGVIKERYFSLPNGTRITIDSEGEWNLPPGGVMVKNFRWGTLGKIFETRMVAKTLSGERLAYSYRWDTDGSGYTSAYRVDHLSEEARTKYLTNSGDAALPDRSWEYPSSEDCAKCHLNSGDDEDFYLGLKSRQFNTDGYFSGIKMHANQIRTFSEIGVLTMANGSPVDWNFIEPPLTPRADTFEGEALIGTHEQARSWLDSNCAYCHNGEDNGQAPAFDGWVADIRVPFADMDICNSGTSRILPGDSNGSSILFFMNATIMPPVSISIPDSNGGINTLTSWVDSMSTCAPEAKPIKQSTSATQCLNVSGGAVSVANCTGNASAQDFQTVDAGNGYVSIESSTGCLQVDQFMNVVNSFSCNAQEWRREWMPGRDFQLHWKQDDSLCLSKSPGSGNLNLEVCSAKDNQRWIH